MTLKLLRTHLIAIPLCSLLGIATSEAQQTASERVENASHEQLQRLLPRYPAADINKDGILSRNEARAYINKRMSGAAVIRDNSRSRFTRKPDFVDVAYGDHARNRLDVWKSARREAQPMIVFIHGGGFRNGDKSTWKKKPDLQAALDAGYAVAALNYPFLKDRPIQDILKDAARAVQFLRSRAAEYHFDPQFMIGWGGSAGAGTSLWLTTRDDLADPASKDPVSQQSSRLQAAVLMGTQATYDLTRWEDFLGPAKPEWRSSENEIPGFYHLKSERQLDSLSGQVARKECDMLEWMSADDGPIWVSNSPNTAAPANRGQYLHHFRHAQTVAATCRKAGMKCELVVSRSGSPSPLEFIAQAVKEARQNQPKATE